MKYSFVISNFLEEISSFPLSIVFLSFFTLITEEDFLISLCFSLEFCIQMDISLLFSYASASLLFSAIWNASSDKHLAFLHFFLFGMVLITTSCTMLQTSVHSSSDTLSISANPLNVFILPLYNCEGFDLDHT